MVEATADANGVALEGAESGEGLAGIGDPDRKVADERGEVMGFGGDRAEVLKEVEGGAFGGKKAVGRTLDGKESRLGRHRGTFVHERAKDDGRIEEGEGALGEREAANDGRGFGDGVCGGRGARGKDGLGGDIAALKVFVVGFFEEAVDL